MKATTVERCSWFLMYIHGCSPIIASKILSLSEKYQSMFRDQQKEYGRRCTVCCFLDRMKAISRTEEIHSDLSGDIEVVDSILKRYGKYMPIIWSNICVIGGLLLDISVESILPITVYIHPPDIITHYMLGENCGRGNNISMARAGLQHSMRAIKIANINQDVWMDNDNKNENNNSSCTTVEEMDVCDDSKSRKSRKRKKSEQEDDQEKESGRKYLNMMARMIDKRDTSLQQQCDDMPYTYSPSVMLEKTPLTIPVATMLPCSVIQSRSKKTVQILDDDPTDLLDLYPLLKSSQSKTKQAPFTNTTNSSPLSLPRKTTTAIRRQAECYRFLSKVEMI